MALVARDYQFVYNIIAFNDFYLDVRPAQASNASPAGHNGNWRMSWAAHPDLHELSFTIPGTAGDFFPVYDYWLTDVLQPFTGTWQTGSVYRVTLNVIEAAAADCSCKFTVQRCDQDGNYIEDVSQESGVMDMTSTGPVLATAASLGEKTVTQSDRIRVMIRWINDTLKTTYTVRLVFGQSKSVRLENPLHSPNGTFVEQYSTPSAIRDQGPWSAAGQPDNGAIRAIDNPSGLLVSRVWLFTPALLSDFGDFNLMYVDMSPIEDPGTVNATLTWAGNELNPGPTVTTIDIELYQGDALKVTRSNQPFGASYNLSTAEKDSISDWGDLRVKIRVVDGSLFSTLRFWRVYLKTETPFSPQVSKRLTLIYNMTETARSDMAFVYSISDLDRVGSDLEIKYGLLDIVRSEIEITYKMREAVSADLAIPYDIDPPVATTVVGSSLQLVYDLLPGLEVVGAEIQAVYTIRVFINPNVFLDLDYHIFQLAGDDMQLVYDIDPPIASSLVNSDLEIVYKMNEPVRVNMTLAYHNYQAVGADLRAIYHLYEENGGLVSASLLLRYDIRPSLSGIEEPVNTALRQLRSEP